MAALDLLLALSMVTGGLTPTPAGLVAALGYVHAYRLFRAAREAGASPRDALRTVADALVPLRVRMLMRAEHRNLAGFALWVRRRQDGVPPGGVSLEWMPAASDASADLPTAELSRE
ncbi:hypothetical protein ACWEPN_41215 [Nonomuraea wenchangensis]